MVVGKLYVFLQSYTKNILFKKMMSTTPMQICFTLAIILWALLIATRYIPNMYSEEISCCVLIAEVALFKLFSHD